MMEFASQEYVQNPEESPEDEFMMDEGGEEGDEEVEGDEIDYEQEAYAYQQQLIQQERTQLLLKQQRQQRILLKRAQNSQQKQGVKLKSPGVGVPQGQGLLRNGTGTGNGSLLKITRTSPAKQFATASAYVTANNGHVSASSIHQGQVRNGGGSAKKVQVHQGSKSASNLTFNGKRLVYYQQDQQRGGGIKSKNGGARATVAGEMFSAGYEQSDQEEDQGTEGESYYQEQGMNDDGDYPDNYGYEGNDQEEEYYDHPEDEGEEEEYPDTLQFCEAQFDDDADDNNDEEARGLPPVAHQGNYGNSDYAEGSSRITTNEAGIRIVESSSVYEPQGEELDYEQYQYVEQPELMVKKVQMNKPRKIRPEKIAADAYLRQLQSDDYDNFTPNILARKLMGVSSQTVQATRPPPLLHKSLQQNSGNKSSSNSNSSSPTNSSTSSAPPTTTISLESILRQQRPSNNSMPRLQPRSAGGGLVLGNQLKIKPNHIIPSVSDLISSTQRQNAQIAQFQKLQMAPQQRKSPSKFLNQQQISRSILNSTNISPNKRSRTSNYLDQQQGNSSQFNNSSSARTNGISSVQSQSSYGNPRQSIASFQQQKNALQLTQTKPQKNVPRCSVCNRTFATNQVLQRHMVLHNGPAATGGAGTESETRKYKCDECFEIFTSPTLLNQHITQTHDSNLSGIDFSTSNNNTSPNSSLPVHRCRVCYRTFTCLESLKAHSLMHDGEFKCRACRRGFSDWNALEEHEATHKRYNCQWCEKYFMNSGNLKAHERIHTGERPYKCQDCPKAFKQLGGLQYHLKTNPNHKPQKYHKNEMMEGSEGNEDGYQYANYEEYDDGDGILDMSLQSIPERMSLADIASANGL